ncbi:MAG: ferric reductase-like transmembrane domain-containing protein [Phycisphaerales bacterium]
MSASYVAISWNRHKWLYDAWAVGATVVFLALFFGVSKLRSHAASDEIVLMRALGACALLLLTVVLCIGPAARLWPSLLPLLYNRRHLGVLTFLVALGHGAVAIGYYHGFGDRNPLVSLLETGFLVESIRTLPYQLFGFGGLVLLFLLAATSHDFWLSTLSPSVWKRLHMSAYGAYGLATLHIVFGALRANGSLLALLLALFGAACVVTVHIAAGLRERRRDRISSAMQEGWIDAGDVETIPAQRARIVSARGGERIAVFGDGRSVSAMENRCAHQGGPLGEGKIIDGCVTCPWHGWQYRASDGCSPPPFTEKVRTYPVRIESGRVFVRMLPLPPGTPPPAIRGDDRG